MDMLLSANDSLSFQEMLDVDIKSEIDTVLGGHSDFSAFNFSELPPLELDDDPTDLNVWLSSNSNHSTSNFNIDFIGSEAAAMMVNPNSVMPLTLVAVPAKSASPTQPQPPRSPPAKAEPAKPVKLISVTDSKTRPLGKTIKISSPSVGRKSLVTTTTTTQTGEIKTSGSSVLNVKNVQRLTAQNGIAATQNGAVNGIRVVSRKQQLSRYSDDEKIYPKPAYSYSCLIAMALKNSKSGSLPVSEIYNFMW